MRTKTRNWHAVNAHQRKAGSHIDKQKKQSKNACRKSKSQRLNNDGI